MGVLRSLLTLPVKGPVNGTLWVARKVEEAATKEQNAPGTLRKALANLERQLLSGEISEEAYDEAETKILLRIRGLE
ncbi:gas vesicle protein GvpG [Yoonia maricola]|uniref:Gas vesicle protein GvpG n=1 Tax=Yoonia maricola TaxID=420999 RepID=A0A2M8WKG9_9RHOB|nr:gas vesicle protein GvpG [Yoonia maricola]PJI91433.1 gas vesicle protein GvpG [Yoonia maricola]